MKFSFTRLLLSTTALVALAGGDVYAKVGIASVVEGEPIGRSQAGTERTLRVGVDMEADEKVTTKDNDRAHLVFLDGTSLTVGPNSSLVIDKYVYDPEKKTGEMALTVSKGTLRFVVCADGDAAGASVRKFLGLEKDKDGPAAVRVELLHIPGQR
ncbi:MAG: FecR domain-containing protein, partial [Enhydrobacter sp.]